MEILGFVLFLIGAGGMDSTGKGYVIAVVFVITGMLLMFLGGAITDALKERRKRKRYERVSKV